MAIPGQGVKILLNSVLEQGRVWTSQWHIPINVYVDEIMSYHFDLYEEDGNLTGTMERGDACSPNFLKIMRS